MVALRQGKPLHTGSAPGDWDDDHDQQMQAFRLRDSVSWMVGVTDKCVCELRSVDVCCTPLVGVCFGGGQAVWVLLRVISGTQFVFTSEVVGSVVVCLPRVRDARIMAVVCESAVGGVVCVIV